MTKTDMNFIAMLIALLALFIGMILYDMQDDKE